MALRAALSALAALAPAAASAAPQTAGAAQQSELAVPFDNVKARAVHFSTHQVTPMAFSFDERYLYTLNQPGARLVALRVPQMTVTAEVPLSAGLSSVAVRFSPREIWVTDQLTSSVTVLDQGTLEIVRTIRVGGEPTGIVFTEDFGRAYVACSAVDQVDVIDGATYQVVKSIAIPADSPRALARIAGETWVASFRSGNNTAPMGENATDGVGRAVEVRDLSDFGSAVAQLPDRDLFAIRTRPDPAQDHLVQSATRTGLGTILFNVHRRPGTAQLWLPGTEAFNAVHRGEVNFVAGRVVQNRLTVVDVLSSSAPAIIDLDALAPPGTACAQPTGLAFDPSGTRAFVCGYGSDNVAVLDVGGAQATWAGSIDLPITVPYPLGTGPRAVLVDSQGRWLYVYNKQNNSVTRVDLNTLPSTPGFRVTAPNPLRLGFSPVSQDERHGRFHFIRAAHSASGTSSCASCHVDGTTDGLAWDLSLFLDPEGTPNDQLAFGLDVKGPMVTQSTQRLMETAPYHWRGERQRLKQFNKTFVGLLERQENGQTQNIGPDIQYIIHYTQRLAYLPNSRQRVDRTFTPQELRGAQLFTTKPVQGSLTCASCHQLPLGTSGEIVENGNGGLAPTGVVPQLRGVGDKLTRPFFVGGPFGRRTESGAGLLHGGTGASIQSTLLERLPNGQPRFDLTQAEADDLAAFLKAFDTGIAPAAGFQVTVHAQNAAAAGPDVALLLDQAQRGHCDVIFRRGRFAFGAGQAYQSGLFDPTLGAFRLASTTLAPLTPAQLLADAAAGEPVTFLGTPLLMGYQMGLDRDVDWSLDLDELVGGTDPENGDSDGDGFPDGYEVTWGMDPRVPDGGSPDTTPPALVGPVRVVYSTSTAIKLEWRTDEMARVTVSYNGQLPVLRLPLPNFYDREFSTVLFELDDDTVYDVLLDIYDPSGNRTFETVSVRTRPLVLGAPLYVKDVRPTVLVGQGGALLHGEVELRWGGQAAPAGTRVDLSIYHQRASDGALTAVAGGAYSTVATPDGLARYTLSLPSAASLGGPGTLYVVVDDVVPTPGGPTYVKGENKTDVGTSAY